MDAGYYVKGKLLISWKDLVKYGSVKVREETLLKVENNLSYLNIDRFVIDDSIKIIGTDAFAYCYDIKYISIPNSVTEIYDFAFNNCIGLVEIVIPNSVTYLEDSAFDGCKNLKRIFMSSGLECINNYMFTFCDSLEKIHYKGKVYSKKDIEEYRTFY